MSDTSPKPIVAREVPIEAEGSTLVIREWTGSGAPWLHVHEEDDEAWHVLEGSLRFYTLEGEFEAPAGTTVFMPAGTAHTYSVSEPSRYLMILTPSLDRLISRLHEMDETEDLDAVLAEHKTRIVGAIED